MDELPTEPVEPRHVVVHGQIGKGIRSVPIAAALRDHIIAHKLRGGRSEGFVFGRSATTPFNPTSVYRRANTAWDAAKLPRIGLHECRHTYVTLMHDAGLSLERIGDYVGHSSAYMTDRYRHLLDGTSSRRRSCSTHTWIGRTRSWHKLVSHLGSPPSAVA